MKKSLTYLSILVSALLSYGMSSPSNEAVQSANNERTDAHLHQGKKTSQSYTKPHAGIQLDFKYPKAMQVGETVKLDLKFKTRSLAGTIQVDISHAEGLQLDSATHYQFESKKGGQHKIPLQITALQEGRFYIDISASITSNGQAQVRSFSIPLTVGDPANFKSSSDESIDSGYKAMPSQGVISMPAKETTE